MRRSLSRHQGTTAGHRRKLIKSEAVTFPPVTVSILSARSTLGFLSPRSGRVRDVTAQSSSTASLDAFFPVS